MRIKEAISNILADNEITKYRLSKHLGVRPGTIDHWLNRDTDAPRFDACQKLFKMYGYVIHPYSKEELENG